jgi:hypothetical protein
MYSLVIKLYGVTAVILDDEILCEDDVTKQLLTPFLETGFTDGPHKGYISKLADVFGEDVELLSVEGEDPDVVY